MSSSPHHATNSILLISKAMLNSLLGEPPQTIQGGPSCTAGRLQSITQALAMPTNNLFQHIIMCNSALVLAGALLALRCLCCLLIEGVLVLVRVISLVEVYPGFPFLSVAANLFRGLIKALGSTLCLYLWIKTHASRASALTCEAVPIVASQVYCLLRSSPLSSRKGRRVHCSAAHPSPILMAFRLCTDTDYSREGCCGACPQTCELPCNEKCCVAPGTFVGICATDTHCSVVCVKTVVIPSCTWSNLARLSWRGAFVGRSASPDRTFAAAAAVRSAPYFWDLRELRNAGSISPSSPAWTTSAIGQSCYSIGVFLSSV